MNIFNAAEIIDMGVAKEKKRQEFYTKVSEEFPKKEMKDLFLKLASWEATHIEKFTKLRKSVDELEATEKYPGELAGYIQALVDDKLYQDVSGHAFGRNVRTAQDAVRYGLEFEKDAILFFRELLPYLRTPHVSVVEQLIEEEKQHMVFLNTLRKTL